MKFPHKPPEGYEYWQEKFNTKLTRIWIKNVSMEFIYGNEPHPSSVWGFYDNKKGCFIAPINHKKPGKVVNINDTTPYSAMQLKLTPLEQAFV